MTIRMTDGDDEARRKVARARREWTGARLPEGASMSNNDERAEHERQMKSKWDSIHSMVSNAPKTHEELQRRKIEEENFAAANQLITQAEEREHANQRDMSRSLNYHAQEVLESQKKGLFTRRGGVFF